MRRAACAADSPRRMPWQTRDCAKASVDNASNITTMSADQATRVIGCNRHLIRKTGNVWAIPRLAYALSDSADESAACCRASQLSGSNGRGHAPFAHSVCDAPGLRVTRCTAVRTIAGTTIGSAATMIQRGMTAHIESTWRTCVENTTAIARAENPHTPTTT